MLAGLELRLDAVIDKVDNLSKDVEISRMMKQYDEVMERPHENLANVTALVAEPEQKYGADAFEEFSKNSVEKTESTVNVAEPIKVERAR